MANDGFPPTSRHSGLGGPQHFAKTPTRPDRVLATTDTMVKAAQLRAAGATFREIGDSLNIDPTWARTLVLKALEAAKYEAADVMRELEGQRLDRMQRAHWSAALAGDNNSTRTIIRIMERRARLFGLDAPTRLEVSEAAFDHSELDRELAALLGAMSQENPDVDDPARP